MISVENGVFAAAAKKPAIPTMTKLAGMRRGPGHQMEARPPAPRPHPPMTIEGPNTPPEPPLPIVKRGRRDLAQAMASNRISAGDRAVTDCLL